MSAEITQHALLTYSCSSKYGQLLPLPSRSAPNPIGTTQSFHPSKVSKSDVTRRTVDRRTVGDAAKRWSRSASFGRPRLGDEAFLHASGRLLDILNANFGRSPVVTHSPLISRAVSLTFFPTTTVSECIWRLSSISSSLVCRQCLRFLKTFTKASIDKILIRLALWHNSHSTLVISIIPLSLFIHWYFKLPQIWKWFWTLMSKHTCTDRKTWAAKMDL